MGFTEAEGGEGGDSCFFITGSRQLRFDVLTRVCDPVQSFEVQGCVPDARDIGLCVLGKASPGARPVGALPPVFSQPQREPQTAWDVAATMTHLFIFSRVLSEPAASLSLLGSCLSGGQAPPLASLPRVCAHWHPLPRPALADPPN